MVYCGFVCYWFIVVYLFLPKSNVSTNEERILCKVAFSFSELLAITWKQLNIYFLLYKGIVV